VPIVIEGRFDELTKRLATERLAPSEELKSFLAKFARGATGEACCVEGTLALTLTVAGTPRSFRQCP
jgi:hypothetical protein